MCSFPPVVLLMLLFLGGAAPAEQGTAPTGAAVRSIELRAGGAAAHTLFIQPGLSTTLLFSSPLAHEGVELERRESFRWVEIGERSISLVPGMGLKVGTRLRLEVRFADGMAPTSAVFHLEVSPSRVERQVEIGRLQISCEACAKRLREVLEEHRQWRETADVDRAAPCEPGGLTELFVSNLVDEQGILLRNFEHALQVEPGAPFQVSKAQSLRSRERVALRLWIRLLEGAAHWRAGSATLRGPAGGLHVLKVSPMTSPTGESTLILEAEGEFGRTQGPYVLELQGADGGRTATIHDVWLP